MACVQLGGAYGRMTGIARAEQYPEPNKCIEPRLRWFCGSFAMIASVAFVAEDHSTRYISLTVLRHLAERRRRPSPSAIRRRGAGGGDS